jgi:hypothetical protein
MIPGSHSQSYSQQYSHSDLNNMQQILNVAKVSFFAYLGNRNKTWPHSRINRMSVRFFSRMNPQY